MDFKAMNDVAPQRVRELSTHPLLYQLPKNIMEEVIPP
jgi:hypothetical protein